MREIIGSGTLFSQMSLLFGSFDGFILFDNYQGVLLAILPPGAFIGLGLIVAFKNLLDKRSKKIA
jgi:electron transport complex protein RnfE